MSEEIAMSAYKKAKTADGKADANTASIASFAQQLDAHKADYAILKTSVEQGKYTPESTEYGDIFSLPSTVVQGVMKGKLKGNTDEDCISVQPQEFKSVGKNKLNLYTELERIDSSNVHLVTEEGRNCVKVMYPASYYQKKILDGWFKPLMQYTFKMTYKHVGTYGGLYINIRYTDGEVVETMSGNIGSFYTTTITSAAGKSISYIELSYGNSNGITYFDIDICQIEEGTTATTYEPYQESKAYLKYPLRSVPNGVCDEVDLQSGKLTKRCEEYVLQASDIAGIAPYTTLDYVQLNKPTDFVGYNNVLGYNASIIIPGFTGKDPIAWEAAENIGGFFNQSAGLIAYLGVPKGTYADLAAAQAAFAGTKIVYQLAEPEVVEDALSNQLTVYPSGTVYTQPYEAELEESTIPIIEHSEPINLAGAVKSESDRNTRQDEQINDIMLLLDYLIVVNA